MLEHVVQWNILAEDQKGGNHGRLPIKFEDKMTVVLLYLHLQERKSSWSLTSFDIALKEENFGKLPIFGTATSPPLLF